MFNGDLTQHSGSDQTDIHVFVVPQQVADRQRCLRLLPDRRDQDKVHLTEQDQGNLQLRTGRDSTGFGFGAVSGIGKLFQQIQQCIPKCRWIREIPQQIIQFNA